MKQLMIITTLLLLLPVFLIGADDQATHGKPEKTALGFSKVVSLNFEEALSTVKSILKKEGFGVLTEVDVQATMKKKLGVDFKPYQILGVCNPPLAYKALTAEAQIGLMLPCKFIVYVNGKDETVVAAVDPAKMMQGMENEELNAVAETVRMKFKKVMAELN